MTADRDAAPALLLVDDDPLIVNSLSFALKDAFAVTTAATRGEALAALAAGPPPAVALIDLGLPPAPHSADEGFALIETLAERHPGTRVVVLSGQNDARNVHHALTLGAADFIPKPADLTTLKAQLVHHVRVQAAARAAAEAAAPEQTGIIGSSERVRALKELIARFADAPFPVLVGGESGVGKELVARALHAGSERRSGPWLALNCAALPPELLEAELFGAARGAYTGATREQQGFFDAAAGGTLFLDEVGELPIALQAKLLRVLENGEYFRLGDPTPRRTDARVVAATNRDLAEEVRLGRFREDLYHRLSVLVIEVPPLRERGDDWVELFQHFAAELETPLELAESARNLLAAYDFPGNVRELHNIVVRLAVKYAARTIDADTLRAELKLGDAHTPAIAAPAVRTASDAAIESRLAAGGFNLDRELMACERRYIDAALKLGDGKLAQAARMLGVNRSTLYSRIRRLRRQQREQEQ